MGSIVDFRGFYEQPLFFCGRNLVGGNNFFRNSGRSYESSRVKKSMFETKSELSAIVYCQLGCSNQRHGCLDRMILSCSLFKIILID